LKVLCCTEFDTTESVLVTVEAEVGVNVSVMVVRVFGVRLKFPDPLRPKGAGGVFTVPIN